jgi:hypothetical protein
MRPGAPVRARSAAQIARRNDARNKIRIRMCLRLIRRKNSRKKRGLATEILSRHYMITFHCKADERILFMRSLSALCRSIKLIIKIAPGASFPSTPRSCEYAQRGHK